MIRNIIAFFRFLKQAKEELNNSIYEKLDEFNRELKESRELQSIEFYEEVKNNRNLAFSSKRFELYQGKISQEEYDRFEAKINLVIWAIESEIIPKEDFFKICFTANKENNIGYIQSKG